MAGKKLLTVKIKIIIILKFDFNDKVLVQTS